MGKKDECRANGEWLPLLQHLEDTSRVCGFLWDHWLCDGQRRIISGNHDQDTGRKVMLFLGAIHDLGKATPAFQMKGSRLRSDLVCAAVVSENARKKMEAAGFDKRIYVQPGAFF